MCVCVKWNFVPYLIFLLTAMTLCSFITFWSGFRMCFLERKYNKCKYPKALAENSESNCYSNLLQIFNIKIILQNVGKILPSNTHFLIV